LPEHVNFINDNDLLIRQKVKFEWLPSKCTHCRMYGHSIDTCRKTEKVRKDWRVMDKDRDVQWP